VPRKKYMFNIVCYDIGHLTIQRTYFFTIILKVDIYVNATLLLVLDYP